MGEFRLFEVTNYNDVEVHDEHCVEEVLCLNGGKGDLLINYFYSDDDCLKNNCNESCHYVRITGGDLIRIVGCLANIVGTSSIVERNMKALYFFPSVIDGEYFKDLYGVYELLKGVVPMDSVDNRERLFLYNVDRGVL